MSQSLYPPTRPLAVGEVLDLAFLLFKATVVKCLPYGVCAMIAGQLPNIYALIRGGVRQPFGGRSPVWLALYCLGILLMLVAWSALLLRQRAIVAHQPMTLRSGLAATLRRLPSFLSASLLVSVAIVGEFALLVLVQPQHHVAALLPLLAVSLYVAVLLSCTWPAVLFAAERPFGAIRSSIRLIRGNWWRTALVYAIGLAVVISMGVVVAMVIPVMVPALGVDIAVMTAVLTVVLNALGAVVMPFFGALLLAVYGELRVRKEGAELQQRIVGIAVE